MTLSTLVATSLWAQTETGQITGTITDPTGSAIPKATVRATLVSTGAVRNVITASDGAYNISNLLPGNYQVDVTAPGFAPTQKQVLLTVGARVGKVFNSRWALPRRQSKFPNLRRR